MFKCSTCGATTPKTCTCHKSGDPLVPSAPTVGETLKEMLRERHVWSHGRIDDSPTGQQIKANIERKKVESAALQYAIDHLTWIQVSDRLPKPGVKVLAFFTNSHGMTRRIRAEWSDGHSLEAADSDIDCDENGFCPEGWYESNEFEETHWRVDETVTHWMPLPSPPQEPR